MTHKKNVHGAGGSGKAKTARVPYEAPNTLRSKATAYIMDILGEGPIEGLVDGLKSVYFDDTPLQAADGTYNFQGVNLVLMGGLPDQVPVEAYAAELNSREVMVGQQVSQKNGPVVRSIVNTPMTRARVTLRVPALFIQDKTSGDINGYSVSYSIEVKASDSGWNLVINDTISGKCTSPYEKSVTFPLPGTGPWQIRVTRQSPDHLDESNIQDSLYWASYTEILDYKLSYPNTAYVGLAFDAELFGGSLPQRSYHIRGLKVAVPENYDPITRTYATTGPGTTGGVWNGSLAKIAWTNNPAWVLYDLLTNKRYGLGSQIAPSMVDKWAFYEIAKYCDELVPDGFGGMEPRFVFNGVINTRDEAYNVLQAVAAVFRGMIYWGAGTITATQDRPASPVKLVTNSNVIGGSFTYEGTALRARHTMANILFNDASNNYKPDIEPVQGSGVGKRGVVPIEITALGVTSRTQARRLGRWVLDIERNETQTCTWRAGLDQIDLRPGDIVLIADRWWQGARFGGRIVSVVGTTVTVDKAVTLDGSAAYIKVTLPDGKLEERQITNGPGTYTQLTVVSPFSQTPQVNSVWMVTLANVQPRPHRVISVAEVEKHVFEITALFHDETKYDRIEKFINREPPSFTQFPTGALETVSNISVSEWQQIRNGAVTPMMTISWSHPNDARVRYYVVEVKRATDPDYASVGVAYGNSIDVEDIKTGPMSVRIRSVDSLGRVSKWAEKTDIVAAGLAWVPDSVTAFKAEMVNESIRLTWGAIRQHNAVFYRIKYSPSFNNISWSLATVLADRVDGLQFDAPPRDGAYLIKAVSLAGVECETAAEVLTSAFSLTNYNVVATQSEAPSWTGQRIGVTTVGSVLTLTQGQTIGTYEFQSIDIGETATVRVTALISAYGVSVGDKLINWASLSDVRALASGDGSKWSAELEYCTTIDDPSEQGWGPWLPFTMTSISARALKFRLTIRSLDDGMTSVEVSDVVITIDVPDRVEGNNNVAIPASGATITFAERFAETPSIAVTGKDLATGDYWSISNQSRTGFTLRFFNAAGVGVARTADWIAKGYGRGTFSPSRKHFRGTLSGTGAVSAITARVKIGMTAILSGSGYVAASTPRVNVRVTNVLVGVGGVSATMRSKYAAKSLLSGSATMRAWSPNKIGKAKLNGAGTVAAVPRARIKPTPSPLAGVGTVIGSPRALLKPTPSPLAGVGTVRAFSTFMKKWDFQQATMPSGITFSRSTKAWYFAAPAGGGRPALTEAPANQPTFEWDPNIPYNSIRNMWGDGAVVGSPGTLPTYWSEWVHSGVSRQVAGKGVEFGLPYVDIRLFGTPTANGNVPIFWDNSPQLTPAKQGETWTHSFFARIVNGSVTGLNFVRIAINEYQANGSTLVAGGGIDITNLDNNFRRFDYTRTLTGTNTGSISGRLILGILANTAFDVTIRVYAPWTARLPYSIYDVVDPIKVVARNQSNVPLYGLRGLTIRRKTENLNKNPRAEGAVAGNPGTDPTGWIVTATGGMAKENFASASLDGIPYGRFRLYGTATGGDGTRLATVYAWGDTTSGTYGRLTGTVGEPVCVSAFVGILGAAPQVKARFVLDEYDANGTKIGSTNGAWQPLLTVQTVGSHDGLSARRMWQAFTMSYAGSTSFVVWLEVANASATTTLDFNLIVGAPQVTKTTYPQSVALPPAGSPGVMTVERDIAYDSVSSINYNANRGLMLGARFELMRGTARLPINTFVLTIGSGGNNNGYRLMIYDDGTINKFSARKTVGSTTTGQSFGSISAGMMQFGAIFLPDKIRYAATGTAEGSVNDNTGLVTSFGGPNIVLGGWGTATDQSTGANAQIDGWILQAAVYSIPDDVAGLVDRIPG